MVFFNCSKKPPCSCFQPCSTTSCNANLPSSDDMGCLLSARQGRVVGRHPLSFYPHFQQEILQTGGRWHAPEDHRDKTGLDASQPVLSTRWGSLFVYGSGGGHVRCVRCVVWRFALRRNAA